MIRTIAQKKIFYKRYDCLVDTISLSATKVIGINVGMAASSGCFIYLSCHERLTFPTAEFLLHKGAGQFSGDYNNVVAAILNYQRQIDELGKFVLVIAISSKVMIS